MLLQMLGLSPGCPEWLIGRGVGLSVLPFFFLGFFSFPLSVPLFLLIKRSLHILF